jgi:hypothetical protein
MGYNYHIVLEEKENENWKEIYRYSNSGSFWSECNHYFLSEIKSGKYIGHDIDDYLWYHFTSEQILEDYDKYSNNNSWKLEMKELIDSSNSLEEAIRKINDLEFEYLPSYWEELEEWSMLLLKNEGKELRVKYGYSI